MISFIFTHILIKKNVCSIRNTISTNNDIIRTCILIMNILQRYYQLNVK